MITDPISDMLTRIRNANMRSYREVSFPFSKFKFLICEKLKENDFLLESWVTKDKREIKVKIKHFNKISSIDALKKISKPSQRIYFTKEEIKKNCLGKRIYLVSTSKGLMTHKEALVKKIGGEIIFFISRNW
ncbi:MAG: 30S ribosomal protein S8 [Mycoplasmataceae bacterium]|nr:MAG: 30S ribosomal protein S8 [Mycoplasmataceae bacterium]